MILYYALGGGLGHVTRALAALHTLEIREKAVVLCSAGIPGLELADNNIHFVIPPNFSFREKDKLHAFIQQLIDETRPREFIVDSFPLGIYGELSNIVFKNSRSYVARILRWDRYTKLVGENFYAFDQTFLLENLHENHRFVVDRIGGRSSGLSLVDPPQTGFMPPIQNLEQQWLILHSGPEEEVDDLICYAKEIRNIENKHNPLLLVNPSVINKWDHLQLKHIRYYPGHLLMPKVDKIITGCGFNVMRQAKPFHHKHHFLPFARRFDDQHLRAAQYRNRITNEKQGRAAGKGLQD
jgi:hypothetical protein